MEDAMIKIQISSDYSKTPGARKIKDGDSSGEDFRVRCLEQYFEAGNDEKIEINLDGVEGYSTAFLEEVFGGLSRKYGSERVMRKISIVSTEEPLLIDEINEYIKKASSK
jgi:hypothetical protein